MNSAVIEAAWEPPARIEREPLIARADSVLAMPDIKLRQTEDIFRVNVVGLDWDMGAMITEPEDPAQISRGADGKKIGIFMLHGGAGDFRSMLPMGKMYAGKFGHKTLSMSYPGHHNFDDPSRAWPGDTISADGTIRTPKFLRGEHITPDQYDVVTDVSMKLRYGTRTVLHAKPGTMFYDRMAGWPIAFEEAMKDAMARHFPPDEYSIYVTGHSTGGPHVFMMCQRVPNIAGVIAVENSPFGAIQEKQHDWSGALGKVAGFERVASKPAPRKDPFYELYIRSWRDRARYAGPEALGQEGPTALMRLPSLMEEVLDHWERTKSQPQFKAQYVITHNIQASLTAAAEAIADRLALSPEARADLVKHYQGFPHPLTGPGAKPVPPVLFVITKDSRDHSPEVYHEVVLPLFAEIRPQPKVRLVHLGAGVHGYARPEKDLPSGVLPTVASLYHEAITSGYFLVPPAS